MKKLKKWGLNLSKGLFITGTGTDIGKTFVTALLLKKIKEADMSCGYYKAVLSGAKTIDESDAGYVKKIARLNQDDDTLISYLYETAVSPHLASLIEGNVVEMSVIKEDFKAVTDLYDYVIVEGSGGVICPIRCDEHADIMLEDIIRNLNLSTVIIADAKLGTINATALTVSYLKQINIQIKGVILNNYEDGLMQRDNLNMIERITKVPVIATVYTNAMDINISVSKIVELFEEV